MRMKKILYFLLPVLLFVCSQAVWADDDGLITRQISITVEKAGTLNTIIGSDKKSLLTNLKVSGPLDLNDVQFLREMAGCYVNDYSESHTNGHLRHLDLTDARFEEDGSFMKVYTGPTHDWENASIDNNGSSIRFVFAFLPELTTIKLPESQSLEMSYGTFKGCSKLSEVVLSPYCPTKIGDMVFENCSALTSVAHPEWISGIGQSAFEGCSSLTGLELYEKYFTATNLGASAFKNCSSLTSIVLPQSITSIGDYAFEGCAQLSSINISLVTNIGHSAFKGCTSLKDGLNFNASPVTIEKSAFEGCCQLPYVFINGNASIGNSAFKDCTNLNQNEVFWGRVTSIGDEAFSGCSSLTDVDFSYNKKVSAIGNGAFSGCTQLSNVTFPISLTSIGSSAFKNCQSLKFVELPYRLNSIGSSAFSGCSLLDSVYVFMENPVSLSNGTFQDVDMNHCVLYVPKGKTQNYWLANGWGDFKQIKEFGALIDGEISVSVAQAGTLSASLSYWEKTHVTNLTVTGSLNIFDIQYLREMASCLDAYGQRYDGHLAKLYLNGANFVDNGNSINIYASTIAKVLTTGLNSSGDSEYLFADLPTLQYVSLPYGLTMIGTRTFMDCRNLISVRLPSSLKTIGYDAFKDCRNLSAISIPSGVTKINSGAFYRCEKLKDIKLPSSLTYIGSAAFYDCALDMVVIPSGVSCIWNDAFERCTNLSVVDISEGVSSIEDYAFVYCI